MAGPHLLVGLSNIGDAVMTTAALEAMHAADPAAVIDIVGDPRSSEIFAGTPFVGRVLHKDKRAPLRGLPALVRDLRRIRYDMVVDLRTDFLPYLLRARRRALRWRAKKGGPHAVQGHLAVVASLCPGADSAFPRLHVRASDREGAQSLLGEWAGRRLLAIGPGANWPPKIWPPAAYAELIESLHHEFDAIVILGSVADRGLAGAIRDACVLPCLDLCGATGLLQAAAVLECASAFIGSDSGLGHMAAAMAVPTLTLFGPGIPERYRPYGPKGAWLQERSGDLARLPVHEVAAATRRLVRGELVSGHVEHGTA